MLEGFRTEIIEAEKGRIDLLKWKLILIAGLGTVGLGLSSSVKASNSVLSTHLLLCLIPLVCIYVDSLCQHLQMRILVISEFFQNYQNQQNIDDNIIYLHAYEKFCNEVRPVFYLEDWAQQGSTIIFSLVTLMFAIVSTSLGKDRYAFFVSGLMGIVLTIVLEFLQKRKYKNIKKFANKLRQNP
jgi:hypothetical protein